MKKGDLMSIPPIDDNKTPPVINQNTQDITNPVEAPDEQINEQNQIQLAMAGPVRKTAVDAAETIIDSFTNPDGTLQNKADVIESPNQRKAKAAENQGENVVVEGGLLPGS